MIWLQDRFNRAILIAVAIVIFFAYMDSQGYLMFQTVGGFGSTAHAAMEH